MLFRALRQPFLNKICYLSKVRPTETGELLPLPDYIELSKALNEDADLAHSLATTVTIHNDFLSTVEEKSIFEEVEPYMSRLKYEFDHWDDAIHGYRETERLKWNPENTETLNRVRHIAFPEGVAQLKYVHVLDLAEKGWIKPHIDAVRFCGDTIAGLSLLTDSVMRLVHGKNKDFYADVFLKRRSLYILTGTARYDYTHEILPTDIGFFKGVPVRKTRRMSVICRNEPNEKDVD